MKVRKGFITNSSSSSFIIGRAKDQTVTIDSVYQEIRELYKQYYKSAVEMYDYVKKYYSSILEIVPFSKGKSICIREWSHLDNVNSQLEQMFGLTAWDDLLDKEFLEWTKCETYKDYEQYWIQKMSLEKSHAPFYIRDFSSDVPFIPLDFSSDKQECTGDNGIGVESYILSWYFPWVEYSSQYDCGNCPAYNRCDEQECREGALKLKEVICLDQACLYILGKICVCSECGYIPEYVVKKLSNISNYSCNHMG